MKEHEVNWNCRRAAPVFGHLNIGMHERSDRGSMKAGKMISWASLFPPNQPPIRAGFYGVKRRLTL